MDKCGRENVCVCVCVGEIGNQVVCEYRQKQRYTLKQKDEQTNIPGAFR